jgi:hypothetical protein
LEAGVGGGRSAAVDCASKVFETIPKSKAFESTEQELAAIKMDMEGMNTREEETGGKVDTVQNLMTKLTDKFSRLEAMFIASMEKQTAIPEKELTKDKPSSSGEQNELTWYEGPPHWRRRTDTEAPPRYEYHYQVTQEMHNSYTEYHDPRRTTQPHSEPQYYGEVQYQGDGYPPHQQFFPVMPHNSHHFPHNKRT